MWGAVALRLLLRCAAADGYTNVDACWRSCCVSSALRQQKKIASTRRWVWGSSCCCRSLVFHVVRERSCGETSIFCSTKILDSQTTADSPFNFTNSIENQTVMGIGTKCMCKTRREVTYLEVMRVFWLMEFEISGEENVQRAKDKKL